MQFIITVNAVTQEAASNLEGKWRHGSVISVDSVPQGRYLEIPWGNKPFSVTENHDK